jgi:hypothetical protein
MDGSYCIKLEKHGNRTYCVGGWLGGGDALSTDPRLTPSGRLVNTDVEQVSQRSRLYYNLVPRVCLFAGYVVA